ncbi:MAG: exosortase-associated EpsI family protein [Lentisphaerota bacterium]
MEKRSLKPYFILIALLMVASLVMGYTVDVRLVDQAGVKTSLPDRVGDWRGYAMRYCQNRLCQREFSSDTLTNMEVCPACGAALDPMTLSEREMLPADTILLKKKYVDPQKHILMTSVVITGKERASIHRAQVCLTAAGNVIMSESVFPVPIAGRQPLNVMLMETVGKGMLPDGRVREIPTFYAYWFVGKGRETPSHVQRMIWMGTDRVFHNLSHRWAYVAVAGMRNPSSEAHKELLASFLQDFYPQIVLN